MRMFERKAIHKKHPTVYSSFPRRRPSLRQNIAVARTNSQWYPSTSQAKRYNPCTPNSNDNRRTRPG